MIDQSSTNIQNLLRLVEELCDSVDAEGADVGGQRRGSLAILREIGPALDRVKYNVPAKPAPAPSVDPAALEQLRELSERATPGPWKVEEEQGSDNFARSIYEDDYKGLLIGRLDQNGCYSNADFIVAAVNLARNLLARTGGQHGK